MSESQMYLVNSKTANRKTLKGSLRYSVVFLPVEAPHNLWPVERASYKAGPLIFCMICLVRLSLITFQRKFSTEKFSTATEKFLLQQAMLFHLGHYTLSLGWQKTSNEPIEPH